MDKTGTAQKSMSPKWTQKRDTLFLPPGTPAAHLRAESDMVSIDARAKFAIISYDQRLLMMPESRLPKLCLLEQLKLGGWAKMAQDLLALNSLSTDIFILGRF